MAALLLDLQIMVAVNAPPELLILDTSVMAAIRSLGGPDEPDVYEELALLFLADVPIHLSALSAAIAAGNPEAVGQIAHRLRGGALEMGALRMAPLCAAIERTARAGSLAQAAVRAEQLDLEFEAARVALEEAIA